MEVAVPVLDLHFDNASTGSYATAPSSPKSPGGDSFDLFRQYTSAPTSPRCAASIYAHINSISSGGDSFPPPPAAAVPPFCWDKSAAPEGEDEDAGEFAFDFSGHLDKEGLPVLTAADELFKEGKIRPLNQRFPGAHDGRSVTSLPRGMWSPGRRGRGRAGEDAYSAPFAAARVESPRGRERENMSAVTSFSSSRGRKPSRSLSPLRGGSFWKTTPSYPETASILKNDDNATGGSVEGGSKKWRLKNFFLFHSASEGRVTGDQSKDPLRKFALLSSTSVDKANAKELENSSFRSSLSSGTGGSMRRGSGHAASSHEKHYAANRAASEDLKKKTALPYRQSLFGCLRINPAVLSIGRGFNSKSFGRW